MSFESPKFEGRAKNDALVQIEAIKQQVYAMGANDYEPSEFARILTSVENGSVDPETGIEQALVILKNKQDYH